MREKNHIRGVLSAVQVVLVVCALAGAAWLAWKLVAYAQAQNTYRELAKTYAPQSSSADQKTASSAAVSSTNDTAAASIDWASLQEECPQVVGWITVEGIDAINYPLVQGSNNDYYLSHDATQAYSIDGALFLDYRNLSFDADMHALVYGHNMLDGSMFGSLTQLADQAFYQQTSGTFTIATPTGTGTYQIFSVNVVDPTDESYQVGFKNAEVFRAFVSRLKNSSIYDTGVDISDADQVVTLSTCSDTGRLIVSGKRLHDGF